MKNISSLERIRALVRCPFELDRIPVIPIMRFTAISLAGYRLRETFDHWEKIAEAETEAWRRFGHDGVFARMTYDVDVAAVGGNIVFHGDTPPQVGPPYLVSSIDDIDRIKEPNPDLCLGMQMERTLTRRLVEQLGTEVPVIGYCQGPFRFASHLRGLQAFMEDLYENTELIFKLLDAVTRISALRAKYQIEAGVHMIEIGDPVASGDLISPRFYDTFAFAYQKALVDQIHAMGDVYVILHICGNTIKMLPKMAETGADILSLDSKVDLESARSLVGDRMVLMGNVDPNKTLALGTPDQVRQQALECIRKAGPSRFILSSGCAMVPDTPPENISALISAVRKI